MADEYCTHCGASWVAGARFCVECGESRRGGLTPRRPTLAIDRYAAVWIAATVLLGGAVAVWVGARMAKEPPRIPPRTAPQAAEPEARLPDGHPPVALPEDVREAIRRKVTEAEAKPDDLAIRKQLGLMQYRAGLIERPYLQDAVKTYEQVLARAPTDLDALRALGDIAVDTDQTQRALEYYERFLALRPEDPYVRTLVGNIQLSGRKTAEAIRSYKMALAADPMLFQAQLGVAFAYAAVGDPPKAIDALTKARGLATDDAARKQVDDILARINAPRPTTAAGAAATRPSGLRADVESMFRSHPIVGPKLDRIDWPNDQTVKVVVREFPMEAMPPFARDKFFDRIKTTVRESKSRNGSTQVVTVELVDSGSGRVMATVTE